MPDPMQVLQLAAANADRLESIDAVNRVMDEVEFVFEYLEPEWQELANQVMDRLNARLQQLRRSG